MGWREGRGWEGLLGGWEEKAWVGNGRGAERQDAGGMRERRELIPTRASCISGATAVWSAAMGPSCREQQRSFATQAHLAAAAPDGDVSALGQLALRHRAARHALLAGAEHRLHHSRALRGVRRKEEEARQGVERVGGWVGGKP